MKVLDVGCGRNKRPGAIGIDKNPGTDADVIHDLGLFPYPFPDDEFEEVYCYHILEHVPDPLGFMIELHRVTRPGGLIHLVSPHYTNPTFPSDLTHRNHLNSYSMECFLENRQLFPFYTDARLEPVRTYVTLANLWRALGLEFLVNLDQKSPALRFTRKLWEHYFSAIVRGKDVYFDLRVIKSEASAR
jgi:ubiquinone/menaquinone biosynthesis C-methylase UbiE